MTLYRSYLRLVEAVLRIKSVTEPTIYFSQYFPVFRLTKKLVQADCFCKRHLILNQRIPFPLQKTLGLTLCWYWYRTFNIKMFRAPTLDLREKSTIVMQIHKMVNGTFLLASKLALLIMTNPSNRIRWHSVSLCNMIYGKTHSAEFFL